MERYTRLRTCADVHALSRGIGESLTLDYKRELGSRHGLAIDVCALANTQGGVLVVGVKNPKTEGSPPKYPEDFVGVRLADDLVYRVESQLIDAISPRVFPRVDTTEDTFTRNGEERYFLLIQVPASSQLHQVTVEKDFRFYRRAEYQNRPMTTEEVMLRMEAILSGRRGTDALFQEEIARLEEIMHGPYVAFLAVPTLEHRLAADPGEPNVRSEIADLANSRQGVRPLVPSHVSFLPTEGGVRGTQQYDTGTVATDCRVRRNSFVTHAQIGEGIDEQDRNLLVSRDSPANSLWRERDHRGDADEMQASRRSASDLPSTIVDPAIAVRVRPSVLRQKVEDFLNLIQGVYDLGGWRGPVRLDAVVSGRSAYPAVSTGVLPIIDYLALPERTTLRAGIEFDWESIETRREDLADDLMCGLARNFGLDEFSG